MRKRGHRLIAWVIILAMMMSTSAEVFAEEQILLNEQTESETETNVETNTEAETKETVEETKESELESETKMTEEAEPKTKMRKAPRVSRAFDLADVLAEITIQIKDSVSGQWVDAPSNYVFSGNESVKVKLGYTVKNEWKPLTTEDVLYYELPDFIGAVTSEEGYVTDGAEAQAGRYKITENGRIEIHFLEKYIAEHDGKITKGTVNFEGELKITSVENGKTVIDFGSIDKEIYVDPDTIVTSGDLKIKKDALDKGAYFDEQTGKTYIDYQVIITAPRSNTKDMTNIEVKDLLPTAGYVTYIDGSFTCDGQSVSGLVVAADKKSFTWQVGTMKPGTVHTLTYKVEVAVASVTEKEESISVKNDVTVNAAELDEPRTVSEEVVLSAAWDIAKEAVRNIANNTVEYTVTLHGGEENDFEIHGVKVSDEFITKVSSVKEWDCKKYVTAYKDFKVDGVAVNIIPNMTDKTFVWNVGTLKPGETKVLTYKIEVDESIWIDERATESGTAGTIGRGLLNKVTATGDNMLGNCSSTADVNYAKQWIIKGGTAEETADGKRIKYTITVNNYDSYLGNKVIDLTNLGAKVTDKITSGNAVYDGELKITRIEYDEDNKVVSTNVLTAVDIDGLTEFTYTNLTGRAMYRFEYMVRPIDESAGALTVDNSAKIGIPGPGGSEQVIEHETSTTTASTGHVVVNKQKAGHDGTEHSWESNIVTPVKANWSYRDYLNVNHSTFTEFIQDSIKVEHDNAVLVEDEDYTLVFSKSSAGENQFHVTFKKDFTGSLTKPIKITYKTLIDETKIKTEWAESTYMFFANYCQVLSEAEEELARSYASTTYYPEYSLTKKLWLDDINDSNSWFNSNDNTFFWEIAINRNGSLTSPTAYLTEIIPEGMELVDIEVHPGKVASDGTITDGYAEDGLPVPTVDFTQDAVNDRQWNITVNKIHHHPAIGSKHQVRLKVITKVTDLSLLDGEKHSFTNLAQIVNASGKTMWEDSASGEIQVEPIKKKSLQGKATIDYTIEVN